MAINSLIVIGMMTSSSSFIPTRKTYLILKNQEMTSNFEKEVEVITQKNTTMGIEEFLLDRARKEGIEKGIEKGKQEGRHGRNIEIAKQMKEENIAIESISRITGLSVDEIKNL